MFGQVKWFSQRIGYGFIVPDEGGEDVMVHISVLKSAAIELLVKGQRVEFTLDPCHERHRASSIELLRAKNGSGASGRKQESKTGRIEWFNPVKGYGFIRPDEGGPDIFVHIRDVKLMGRESLPEGASISYRVERRGHGRNRGREFATNLRLI